MKSVAIVGVGLIGGSFALALRKAGYTGRITGVSSPRTIDAALAGQVIDGALSLEEAVAQSDLIYLSQPINRILQTLDLFGPLLGPGTLVTDAGSTKVEIVDAASRAIRRGQFLGGHPMAGKEKRGVEQADPDLFNGRTWVLTPTDPRDLETPAAVEFVEWIRRIGAVPVVLPPAEHDRVVAYTSHLAQLASTALAATVARQVASPAHLQVTGPGLAGMTRLALSTYDIWQDILNTNTAEIDSALRAYLAQLEELRANLTTDRIRREFGAAAEFADQLRRHPR